MEVQRKGRLWLASGRATACFWLRGRPMNGGLALASLVSAGEGIGCLGVVCVLARERAETGRCSPAFLFKGRGAACGCVFFAEGKSWFWRRSRKLKGKGSGSSSVRKRGQICRNRGENGGRSGKWGSVGSTVALLMSGGF